MSTDKKINCINHNLEVLIDLTDEFHYPDDYDEDDEKSTFTTTITNLFIRLSCKNCRKTVATMINIDEFKESQQYIVLGLIEEFQREERESLKKFINTEFKKFKHSKKKREKP